MRDAHTPPTIIAMWALLFSLSVAEAFPVNTSSLDLGMYIIDIVGKSGAALPNAQPNSKGLSDAMSEGIRTGVIGAPHFEWEEIEEDPIEADPLFSNIGLDLGVTVLAMVATISAAASGIGGGGLLVPIYLLVMGWHISLAVPLSNATIFGNSLTNIFINFPLRHPTADRPLVDFDLALILIPMELTGSLVGVLLNIIFPQWLTLLCLLLLLLFTTYRTYIKGRASWDKENEERRRLKRRAEASKAAEGTEKEITVQHDGQEYELKVVKGQPDEQFASNLKNTLSVNQSANLRFVSENGEILDNLSFNAVEGGVRYNMIVEAHDEESKEPIPRIEYGFRTAFGAEGPSIDETLKLQVHSTEGQEFAVLQSRLTGKGKPIMAWNTDDVVSWLQAVTTGNDAQCYNIEMLGLNGATLLKMATEPQFAHQELLAIGVPESRIAPMLRQLRFLLDNDYMLLVHKVNELPWGKWNKNPNFDGKDDDSDVDLDGWRDDDPLHPKNDRKNYLAGDSYVNIHTWDTSMVLRWLDKVTDYNYVLRESVLRNEIDGSALLKLSLDDLRELGVPQMGPRIQLYERIRELEELYKEHEQLVASERDIPWSTNLLILLVCWVMLLVLAILRGGGKKGGQSPVANWQGKSQEEFCGTAAFWVLWWIGVPVLVIVTYFSGNYLLNKHRRKVHTHFKFHDGDIHWTERRVRLYPMIVVIAGVLAGLLGVGGAMITGPMMLEMNMVPRVSTATSSFLIIFTTGVAAIAYISLGSLRIDYGIWFACTGALGGLIGLKIIGMLIRKYNRQSLVIWSLTVVFILAAIGTVAAGVTRLQEDISDGKSLGFREICG